MLNKVLLIGRVGFIDIKDNRTIISLATNTNYKDKTDVKWHTVAVFSKTKEFIDKYIYKGALCFVEGEINYYKTEDKTYTSIITNNIKILSKKQDSTVSKSDNVITSDDFDEIDINL